jgi:hypothetical protein
VSSPGRIEQLAREIAAREAERAGRRAAARDLADRLHATARDLLRRFARAAGAAGAPHLDLVRISPVEPDDKSIRAWQFRIWRGRWEAIVVSKDRGEVMLVGPFKPGEPQGPCNPFHLEGAPAERDRLRAELPELICRLIEAAYEK